MCNVFMCIVYVYLVYSSIIQWRTHNHVKVFYSDIQTQRLLRLGLVFPEELQFRRCCFDSHCVKHETKFFINAFASDPKRLQKVRFILRSVN